MNQYQRNISDAINPCYTFPFETFKPFNFCLRSFVSILSFAMINMHYLSPYSYIRLGRLCYFYVIFTSPLGNTVSKIVQAPRQSFIHFAFSFTDMYYSRSKHLIMCTQCYKEENGDNFQKQNLLVRMSLKKDKMYMDMQEENLQD